MERYSPRDDDGVKTQRESPSAELPSVSVQSSRRVIEILFVASIVACEPSRHPPPRPPRPPRPASAPPLDGAASLIEGARRPLPDAVARCVEAGRRGTPPALQGALALIGGEGLIEAGCRLELAPRLRSPGLCEGISPGTLRDACRLRAAMAVGDPARCPEGARAPRDPVCVAIAARDLGLCAAAGSSDRPRCEAIGRGDAAPCRRLDPLLRPGCEREVAALREVLPRVGARSDAATRPSALVLRCDDDAGVWSIRVAQRGVFLDVSGRVLLLPESGRWPEPWAPGVDEPTLALRFGALGVRRGARVSAEVALLLPHLAAMRSRDGSADATATIERAPAGRGSRVRASLSVLGRAAGIARRCELSLDAFVRDVVPDDTFGHHPDDAPMDRRR